MHHSVGGMCHMISQSVPPTYWSVMVGFWYASPDPLECTYHPWVGTHWFLVCATQRVLVYKLPAGRYRLVSEQILTGTYHIW